MHSTMTWVWGNCDITCGLHNKTFIISRCWQQCNYCTDTTINMTLTFSEKMCSPLNQWAVCTSPCCGSDTGTDICDNESIWQCTKFIIDGPVFLKFFSFSGINCHSYCWGTNTVTAQLKSSSTLISFSFTLGRGLSLNLTKGKVKIQVSTAMYWNFF